MTRRRWAWVVLAAVLPFMASLPGCSLESSAALREENNRLHQDIKVLEAKLEEIKTLEAEIRELKAGNAERQTEFDRLAASHPEAARRVREATMNR